MPEKTMTTNLPLPISLRKRILKLAAEDDRTLKPQIKILLMEAVAAREAAK